MQVVHVRPVGHGALRRRSAEEVNTDRPRIRKRLKELGFDIARGEGEELVHRIRKHRRRLPHARRTNIEGFVDREYVKYAAERLTT